MTFETWPEDYIPVKVAYERAVGTLEPEARPGDEYLMASDEDAAAAAYAWIDDAELQIESLLRDALTKEGIAVIRRGRRAVTPVGIRRCGATEHVRVEGAVSFDNIFAPDEPQMAFVGEGQFDRWLSKVREGRRQSPTNDDVLSLIRCDIEKL